MLLPTGIITNICILQWKHKLSNSLHYIDSIGKTLTNLICSMIDLSYNNFSESSEPICQETLYESLTLYLFHTHFSYVLSHF